MAVDLGTTTLAAELIDLNDGSKLGTASRMNPQVAFGDDVLARIRFAREDVTGLSQMQLAIIGAVGDMITELVEAQGASRERVYEVFLSGNTTMQQIFLGFDIQALGEAPFVAVTTEGLSMHATRLGLNVHPRAMVSTMPVIGGFCRRRHDLRHPGQRMLDEIGNILFIDIGTNGELAIWANGQLLAAQPQQARRSKGQGSRRGCVAPSELSNVSLSTKNGFILMS